MLIPNSYNIYSPSKLIPKREVSYSEFISRYAEEPRSIQVCFEDTCCEDILIKNSHQVTAYNCGLGCWYIVDQAWTDFTNFPTTTISPSL